MDAKLLRSIDLVLYKEVKLKKRRLCMHCIAVKIYTSYDARAWTRKRGSYASYAKHGAGYQPS
jgi:hypothetical protein